jgi:hypothetical protein
LLERPVHRAAHAANAAHTALRAYEMVRRETRKTWRGSGACGRWWWAGLLGGRCVLRIFALEAREPPPYAAEGGGGSAEEDGDGQRIEMEGMEWCIPVENVMEAIACLT